MTKEIDAKPEKFHMENLLIRTKWVDFPYHMENPPIWWDDMEFSRPYAIIIQLLFLQIIDLNYIIWASSSLRGKRNMENVRVHFPHRIFQSWRYNF